MKGMGVKINCTEGSMKLTKAMKAQLLEYLYDVQQRGGYWGNREQFWKRHDKIVEWVEDQKGGV
jgi:hypothetical protein